MPKRDTTLCKQNTFIKMALPPNIRLILGAAFALNAQISQAQLGDCNHWPSVAVENQTFVGALAAARNMDGLQSDRFVGACQMSRQLHLLGPEKTNQLSDQDIDSIASFLAEDSLIQYYAALSLAIIGRRAGRALPALERACEKAYEMERARNIGSQMPRDEILKAAIRAVLSGS